MTSNVLLRPKWVAGHLLALVLTTAFIAAGFWQVARNGEAHRKLQEVKAQFAAPAPAIATVNVATGASANARVTVTGTFVGADALLRNQLRGSQTGYDVLSVLRLADGRGVVVDRGWVTFDRVAAGLGNTARPTGVVTVRGVLQHTGALETGEQAKTEGGLTSLPRVDTRRLAPAGLPMLDAYVQAQYQQPAPAAGAPALPKPTSNAEVNQVNHVEYAIEWFSFAAIAVIGWPIVLWQFTRRNRRRRPPAADVRLSTGNSDAERRMSGSRETVSR